VELPRPFDFRATFVDDMPLIVARDLDGTLVVFDRCAITVRSSASPAIGGSARFRGKRLGELAGRWL
jgi:hypothetical protein